jgi:hypothetical protein
LEELAGRVAAVTGGGSGIGAALARACADAGMDVAVADIEAAKAEAVAGELRARGRRALAAVVDVRRPESVQAFADRRPDRIVWPDRTWEWLALTEDGNFNAGSFIDLGAREKWFYQAIGASSVLFRRRAGQGSLYWANYRDKNDAYLDGSLSYRLTVPQPVPGKLFWSVTVYDPDTRSQIQTSQCKAALRSLFELKDQGASGNPAELYFGPEAPAGHDEQWVRTLPGQGWFAVFRIYVPEPAAFSGSWRPGDFEQL